jgi:hypothetical protein
MGDFERDRSGCDRKAAHNRHAPVDLELIERDRVTLFGCGSAAPSRAS